MWVCTSQTAMSLSKACEICTKLQDYSVVKELLWSSKIVRAKGNEGKINERITDAVKEMTTDEKHIHHKAQLCCAGEPRRTACVVCAHATGGRENECILSESE